MGKEIEVIRGGVLHFVFFTSELNLNTVRLQPESTEYMFYLTRAEMILGGVHLTYNLATVKAYSIKLYIDA